MTLIIAEAGVNHNGDIGLAREMVAIAAEAGADLVKFQTFDAERIVSASAPKAAYQILATGSDGSQRDMIADLQLSRRDHEALVAECEKQGVRFLSTAFDCESLDMLLEFGIDRIKVPSGEMVNFPFLRHVAVKGLPVILSTGMASLAEVASSAEWLFANGLRQVDLSLLHCNTQYPTPMPDVNLRAMTTMAAALGTEYGYSDHTAGIEISIAAVALGASVIEKHFTIDRGLPGPDHRASLEPAELGAMVAAIRNVEAAMSGDGVKRPSASEKANIAVARPSIVAKTRIAAGEPFSEANCTTKRPGTGISPMRWLEIMGHRAPRDFAPDELIEL